ncbi:beta-propeller domain-containing protein [Hydrogenoanaerobacterium sp.]|uniref:beta-propeller domain-containing protein n=1 Tax=Hydrogenoanaerobacterium sp. TaxID=2953763 RepID=UPI00289B628E|nr:beta-propeller domain-containing protein [Hydrogenoanaerobacterium sp.]
MADLYEQDNKNLEYLSQRLKQLDSGIIVPESVKASQLLERITSPEPPLKVVKTVKWQKLAGVAAAFVLVLGSVLHLNRLGSLNESASPQSPAAQAAMDAATPMEGETEAFSADAARNYKGFSAPAGGFEEMSSYYAKDYSQIRVRLKSVQTEPMAQQKAPAKDDKKTNADTGAEVNPGAAPDTGGGMAHEVYTTNAQTQGIDEADIVKTDGEYLYYLYTPVSKNSDSDVRPMVKIIDAKSLAVVSSIQFPADVSVSDLFLAGDKLAVMYENPNFDHIPQYKLYDTGVEQQGTRTVSATALAVYNVANTAKPVREYSFEQQGDYVSSRLVDNTVYLVTQSVVPANAYIDEVTDDMLIPSVRDTTVSDKLRKLPAPDICIPAELFSNAYTVVSAVSLTGAGTNTTKAVLGGGSTVYMSPHNLYVAGSSTDEATLEETTTLLKFGVEGTKIELLAQGNVPGRIDGQFALDESSTGDLRIATTRRYYADPIAAKAELEKQNAQHEKRIAAKAAWFAAYDKAAEQGRGEEFKKENPKTWIQESLEGDSSVSTHKTDPLKRVTDNNVYVLNQYLERIGTLEGLAPDETIYSVRYIDDIAYIVTYKQVDPLFAIDLSDPQTPKVLGQLKIPGFSEYLHPIDDDTLLGFGYDTATKPDGAAITKGLKLSLFDISNPQTPKETQVYQMGDRGSNSEALYNHKAFVYYGSKDIVGIPVTLFTEYGNNSTDEWARNYKFAFDGLYLFQVTEEKIEYLGSISQSGDITDENQLYDQGLNVQRGVYIGDTIYTFSRSKVTAHSISDLEKLAEINL